MGVLNGVGAIRQRFGGTYLDGASGIKATGTRWADRDA
jgi:hypothetical protein